MVKNNFIQLKKAHFETGFVGLIHTNKLETFWFFQKLFLQGLGAFFTTAKNH